MNATATHDRLRALGGRLLIEGDKLVIESGSLPEDLREAIRRHRDALTDHAHDLHRLRRIAASLGLDWHMVERGEDARVGDLEGLSADVLRSYVHWCRDKGARP
ncbi:MAG: hypothetical protein ACXIUZ_01585 [Lysobacteraceae bacterium]